MIRVTRLSGSALILNAELIKFVESTPDTLITLKDGEKLMVKEPADEVVRLYIEFRRRVQLIP